MDESMNRKRVRKKMGERNLNFDKEIDRRHTNCLKYDFTNRKGMPEKVLPLWVADMDFRISSYIQDALHKQVDHGIYGYSEVQEEYYEALSGYMKRHHNWDVKRHWLIKTPSVVFALAMAVQTFTEKGDKVLIQKPVYYPFQEVIEKNDRIVVDNPLIFDEEDNTYRINFEDFEKKIIQNRIKLFLLCNPQNPTGRVFTKEELITMGDICYRHHVIVVSDEIHEDFVWDRHTHSPFASLKEEYKEISITCTSPSKTFNIAGLQIANIFIPNTKLRRKYRAHINAAGYNQLNAVGLVGCEAAYRYGDEWLDGVRAYIKGNIDFTREYLVKYLPQIEMIEPEGTYLVWLNCRKLGLTQQELDHLMIHKAGLWLDSGTMFGNSGTGFQRINVACTRKTLTQALNQLRDAIDEEE